MKRLWRCLPLVLTISLVAAGGGVLAQTEQRVPVDLATTQQKARFVESLVGRSVAAQTIETQGDAAAKESLATARTLVGQAKADLEVGDYQAANEKLNEALELVNQQARKISEADVKQEREAEAYEKQHNAVLIFLSAYERVADEKALSATTTTQVAEIRELVAEAEAFAQQGRHSEANAVLKRAYLAARGDIREMRDGETLTRSLNFATAEEEFNYERDRNDSHVALLQYAIDEKNPSSERLERIGALRQQAAGLRQQAEQQAAAGDHATAIGGLIQSTDTLLKAIRMSGIWIPG